MKASPAADTYQDVEKLIKLVVYEFQRRHGGDIEEMLCVANLVFMDVYRTEIDPKKGTFNSLLTSSIRRRLIDHMVIGGRRSKRTRSLDVENENGVSFSSQVPNRPSSAFDLQDFARQVSEDAKVVLSLVFDSPAEVVSVATAKGGHAVNWQSTIRWYLKKLGWKSDRITMAYEEIQLALEQS